MAKEGKQVIDVKGGEKQPEKKDNRVEVVRGNIDVLNVQMLNSINQNLVSILGVLKVIANEQEK